MKDFFGLFFNVYWDLIINGPPQFAVIPVTVCVVAPACALYWLFVLDAFRKIRYAISGNESRGTRPFVFFLFAPSFALGAISYLQTTGLTLGVDSYARYRGGGDGALVVLAYVVPGIGSLLVFYIGMALSLGSDPPLQEWIDRWRPTHRSRRRKDKRGTQKTHFGWAWFRLMIWIPCVAMAVSVAGIAATAIGRILVRSFVELANA